MKPFQASGSLPRPRHTRVHAHALSTNAYVFLGKTLQKDRKEKSTVLHPPLT